MVNTSGRVIGLNTLGFAAEGGSIGFAVPAATVQVVVDRFRSGSEVGWAWTGLQLQALKDFQRNTYFEGTDGVVVAGVDEGSPALEAGFRSQDRLLILGDEPVSGLTEEDLPDLRRRLALLPSGRPVKARVRRGGTGELTLSLTPRAKGPVMGEELECARWDFTVKAVNQFETPEIHFHRPDGVYIQGVRNPGNAMGVGLLPKDILLRVNGAEIRSVNDVRRLHAESLAQLLQGGSRRLVLTVQRNGQVIQIVLDLSRDFSRN